MIYADRPQSPNQVNHRIRFRGFEISIASDDRSRGGNAPLSRSSLVVFKGDQEVTYKFAGRHNTTNGAIEEVDGEALFEVMKAIAEHPEVEQPRMVLDIDFKEEEDDFYPSDLVS